MDLDGNDRPVFPEALGFKGEMPVLKSRLDGLPGLFPARIGDEIDPAAKEFLQLPTKNPGKGRVEIQHLALFVIDHDRIGGGLQNGPVFLTALGQGLPGLPAPFFRPAPLPDIVAGKGNDQQQQGPAEHEQAVGEGRNFRPYVFDIDPRAHDPLPGAERFDVRNFRNNALRVVFPLPHVVHEAAALRPCDADKLAKEKFPAGVGIIRYIAPQKILPVGMHDELRGEIVDPEVVFAFRAVAHAVQQAGGLSLGFVAGQEPLLFLVVVVGQALQGGPDQFPDHFLLGGQQTLFHHGDGPPEDDQHEQCHQNQGRDDNPQWAGRPADFGCGVCR